MHEQSSWVYDADLPLGSPEVLALPPRQRQTLQYVLAGNREREIAATLGLSVNTVHDYVKALHRHFGVSRRDELLTRWDRSYHSGGT